MFAAGSCTVAVAPCATTTAPTDGHNRLRMAAVATIRRAASGIGIVTRPAVARRMPARTLGGIGVSLVLSLRRTRAAGEALTQLPHGRSGAVVASSSRAPLFAHESYDYPKPTPTFRTLRPRDWSLPTRRVMTACVAIGLVSASTFALRADDKTLLIELETRSESLPTAVSASGAMVDARGRCTADDLPDVRLVLTEGLAPLGLPHTLSRAPRRRRPPFAWLARARRRSLISEIVSLEAI